jgi:hypothetical protein
MVKSKNVKISGLLTTLLAVVSLVGCTSERNASQEQANIASTGPKLVVLTYTYTVQARPEDWQHSGIELKQGDSATLIASGEWYVVRTSDSGGNGTAADGSFALPGRPEGCLILRMNRSANDGDTLYFEGNGKPVYVNTPGEFFFLANDSHHPDMGAGRPGYADNTGALTVTIKIQTSHPENYPPMP